MNALPQLEVDNTGAFAMHCASTLLCMGCPKAEDTVNHSMFEVQYMAVLIQNQEKVFHKAKVKVILHAPLLQGAWL